jgi:hypothetical protein
VKPELKLAFAILPDVTEQLVDDEIKIALLQLSFAGAWEKVGLAMIKRQNVNSVFLAVGFIVLDFDLEMKGKNRTIPECLQ